jgi:hypothetical protein
MGRQVHDSRLLLFLSRPVPDLLKPAYNFGGISMSQLAMPYVQRWLKTVDSVNKLISNYSTSAIKSNLGAVLSGGLGQELINRAQLFTQMRDNQGLMLLDKETEDFFNIAIPLGSLDKLQAQAQEHMAACSQIPLIVLLGIQPAGLNASSEGEIRVFYDYVHDQQEAMFRDPLEHALRLIMLSEFGEIDEDITFEFEPLFQLNGMDLAKVREQDANSATAYVAMGAVSSEEVRKRLAKDPESGFDGIDVDDPDFQPTTMPSANTWGA